MIAEADDECANQGDNTDDAIHEILGDDAKLEQIEELELIGSTTWNGGVVKEENVYFL